MLSLLLGGVGFGAGPEAVPTVAGEIAFTRALVIRPVGRFGRWAVHTDAIEAQVVAGHWTPPRAGDTVTTPDGAVRTWESLNAKADGWFEHAAFRGGYADVTVESDRDRVMVLEARGHGMVYVNGEPRVGDPYAYGYVRLPVWLRRGSNDFLFHCPRGRFKARLVPPASPAVLNLDDPTLPDLIEGESRLALGAIVVLNASTNELDHAELQATGNGSVPGPRFPFSIPPLGTRKVAFSLIPPRLQRPGDYSVRLELIRLASGRRATLSAARVGLRVRSPGQTFKRTFLSPLDDSVQYYAVNPAHPLRSPTAPPALFLSLHGASVEAIGQADAYSPKAWGHIVCPTNRRPYGFDWEDWGRLDALEVLDLAQEELHTDPQRVYLTGHSMGGHGAWQLGALFPDRFAAVGPSAGWISFTSYVETNQAAPPDAIADLLRRSAAASDTLRLETNFISEAIYILHGSQDDNVPVREARTMRAQLSRFHHDFEYYEQPGVGHWWDISDEPGADCVDWAPMFDCFARHRLPADDEVRRIRFTTVNPAISARCHWLVIEAQRRQGQPSSVDARWDPGRHRVVGSTENVARLSLAGTILEPGSPLTVSLDGQSLTNIAWPAIKPGGSAARPAARAGAGRIWLERKGDSWALTGAPAVALKGPHRYGPFKEAFRNHMVLVYGTRGTAEETEWALAKARFDAGQFWYRGNGSVSVLSDSAYLRFSKEAVQPGRYVPNVILYGNADSNAAWPFLLADSPVQVSRGTVRVGDHELRGEDLACVFVRPNPRSDHALVGAVSGTGLPGLRLTDRLPYFISGLGYPDCTVIGPEMLTQGVGGIRGAGFFGLDWGVADGEFVWAKP
ncbi:MAG: prolyl oligopeptidase family serine peptidase [Verrucomicrobia bacterium]|nr:prolyl oligopeptidase family serine peptidase [Verrucomicrobiota bacterium]